jgi:hypothetical protein
MTFPSRKIDRIDVSEYQKFHDAYAAQRMPVILTNVFRNQSISFINSLSQMRDIIGNEKIRIKQNYIKSISQEIRALHSGRWGKTPPEKIITVNEYLSLLEKDPSTSWQATELPSPQPIIDGLNLGELGLAGCKAGYHDRSALPPNYACSLMFLASSGNASDLHCDWDGRDVFLYQAAGRKRVTLFKPHAASLLHPIQIYSTVKLHGWEEAYRSRFIEYAEGWDDVLYPGEAVFMPAFYWHHLEYLDTGLSFSFRYGGISDPDHVRILKSAHADMHLQRVMAATLEPKKQSIASQSLIPVLEALKENHSSPRAKYVALSEAYRNASRLVAPNDSSQNAITWIDCNALLDGTLCNRYNKPGEDVRGLKRLIWDVKAKLHLMLRMFGHRLASRF